MRRYQVLILALATSSTAVAGVSDASEILNGEPTPNTLANPSGGLQATQPLRPSSQQYSLETAEGVSVNNSTAPYRPSPVNSIVGENLAKEASISEGRRLKGGLLRRLALPLLILLGIKAGLGLPILFGGVALAAFKGLWTGSTALVVTAALALRGLLPPPKVIVASHGHHAHVTDYLADYKRADDYRDDYGRYGSYGWK